MALPLAETVTFIIAAISVVSGPVIILTHEHLVLQSAHVLWAEGENRIDLSAQTKAAICVMGSLMMRRVHTVHIRLTRLKVLVPAVHDEEVITWDPFGQPEGARTLRQPLACLLRSSGLCFSVAVGGVKQ